MERRSYTRLTLALDIVGKIQEGPLRGYHELSTVKHQIDLHDTITIEPYGRMHIECNHPLVPCDERNICHKAVVLVQKEFGIDQPVRITIDKKIPVMGGLAGGSANAATALQILDEMWELHCSTGKLMELGRALGMDVPFYFIGGTAFDSEAGGVCTPLPTGVGLSFVLALPEFGVSTADAYGGIDYTLIGKCRPATGEMGNYFIANNRDGVVSCIHNDFELSVFKKYPRLASIKQELIDAGCETAALSGSGSTVLGVVGTAAKALEVQGRMSCRTLTASTLLR